MKKKLVGKRHAAELSGLNYSTIIAWSKAGKINEYFVQNNTKQNRKSAYVCLEEIQEFKAMKKRWSENMK